MFSNVHNILDNDYPQVCRLCLVKEENLIYIFDPEGYQGFRLWEVIKELLQVEVSKEDGLPWTICKGCLDKVKDFKRFKTTCIHAKISFLTIIANRGFVSSMEHGLPTPPSRDATKIIRKRPSSQVNTKDSDEAEVVEIVKEESPDTSADEDPLVEITVSPKERESGHSGKSSLAHGLSSPTSGEATKIIQKRPSSQVNRKDSDEVEVVEIVKEESPDTSADEDSQAEVTVSPKERERGHRGMANVKEEDTSSESMSELENSSEEYPQQSESSNDSVSNIVYPPHEMEDLVDGCRMTGWSPKMWEEIVTDREEDREKNIIETIERNPSLSGLPRHHSLINIKKCSKKRGKSLKSSDYKTNAFNFSGMMPSEQMHLDSHGKKFGGYTEFICDNCGSTCTDKNKLAVHVRSHILSNRPSKSVLPQGLSQLCLESGATGIQISKPFECEMCGKKFKSKKELKGHLVVHSNLKPFICESCGKGFKRKKNLVTHSVIHTGLRPYKCETCGKGYTDKSGLVQHSVMHTGLRPIKCDTCGKGFTHKSYLVKHLVVHTGLRPYKCETCGKGFTYKSSLVKHSVIHTGVRTYKCDTCGKRFPGKCNLVTHSVIHTGLRPYKCETCGKGFFRKSDLVKHSVIHSGLRPYKCDTCGKRFPGKRNLVTHSVIHTGLRPYKCDTCGKGFTQSSHLVRHSVMHTGLRPYKCDTFGKGFTQRSNLVKHLVMHTGLRPFKCKTCGKDFKWRLSLRKHLMTHN